MSASTSKQLIHGFTAGNPEELANLINEFLAVDSSLLISSLNYGVGVDESQVVYTALVIFVNTGTNE
jgi:hypothetical protein